MIYDIFPVNNYQGNGSSTVFDFDFYIDNASQLKVYLFDSDGAKYLLEHEIDYSLEGEQNPNGGYITFPLEDSNYSILSEGQKLSLELDIPVSQETQYNNSSLLNLGTLEYSFDYLTRLIQILKRKLSLCVKVEECSNNTPEELIKLINDAHVSTSLDAKEANSQKLSAQVAAQNAQKYLKLTEEISNDIATFYDEFRLNGMYKFNLFDTKISDHILEGNEAKGWALQGTYVSGALYPDFYAKCLEEKNNATATETTLADSTLTMFVNDNGHQFYNIADKSIVDTFYNICGVADFYGIDEENEKVFLPRNKYFAIQGSAPVVGNGLSLGLTNGSGNYGIQVRGTTNVIMGVMGTSAESYGEQVGVVTGTTVPTMRSTLGVTTDSTKSGIEVHLVSDEKKYLYYCIGNTVVNDAEINAGALAAQMELKANKTDVDGQWVMTKAVTLASEVAVNKNTTELTYDLSDYLPNDGYNYEVLFETTAITGSTSGQYMFVRLLTDYAKAMGQVAGIYLCNNRTRSSSYVNMAGNATLPVGNGRSVIVWFHQTSDNFNGSFNLWVVGYRRIGTNI